MYDSHAQSLQQQALRALSDLRGWLWAHHAQLLPEDAASVSRENAVRFAAYLDWFAKVDEALLALDLAGERLDLASGNGLTRTAELLRRPTVRLAEPCPPTARSVTSHRTISIAAA